MPKKAKIISAVKWIYVLENDFTWQTSRSFDTGYAFYDSKGIRRLEISSTGVIKVLKGYAWDGCTPKFKMFDLLFGTPEGIPHKKTLLPKTYFASLVHDALYQFLDAGSPFSRRQVDKIFLHILTEYSFAPRNIYYAMVRAFGGLFLGSRKLRRRYHGRSERI
jgi:hypothetical protein